MASPNSSDILSDFQINVSMSRTPSSRSTASSFQLVASITVQHEERDLPTRLNALFEETFDEREFFAVMNHDDWTADLFIQWYFEQPASELLTCASSKYHLSFREWTIRSMGAIFGWSTSHPGLCIKTAALKTYFFLRMKAIAREGKTITCHDEQIIEDLMHAIIENEACRNNRVANRRQQC